MRYTLQTLTLLLVAFSTVNLFAQNVLEYRASYTASANGIRATASRELVKLPDNRYQLSNSLRAEFAGTSLAALQEESTFRFAQGLIQPLSYAYNLSGIAQESKSIGLNWDAKIAVSSEGLDSWTLQLLDNTQDPLSYQLALRIALLNEDDVRQLEIPVIDKDEIEIQRFRLLGEETLATKAGLLTCLKLERVNDEGESKSTLIWLAKDWNFLLAKIERNNGKGLTINLNLDSAEVDGVTVN